MNIAICGANGFIGTQLCEHLENLDHQIFRLSRSSLNNPAELRSIIDQCDCVINLAGAPINKYWTKKYKKLLFESRIGVTRKLVAAINLSPTVRIFISASAVGYYDSNRCFEEDYAYAAESVLGRLCYAWESEASKVKSSVRLAITRFGIVLSKKGGAFEKFRQMARMGFITRIGNGKQSFSFIDIDDLVHGMDLIIQNNGLRGAINFVTPKKISQRIFAAAVRKHYHIRFTLIVPKFLLKLVLGEASELFVHGQCAIPEKLLNAGFQFKYPDIFRFLEKPEA